MENTGISTRFLNSFKKLFYNTISPKFRSGYFKKTWDWLFIIFEKIAYEFSVFSISYIDWYHEIVDYEINLAKITVKDNVLVIGCGSLPATSILIAKKTNANVLSVDIDKKAIVKAEEFVEKRNLENKDKLKFLHVNNLDYLDDVSDVIFILFGVKKPQEIFKKIIANKNDNCRIIFRVPTDKDGTITKKKDFVSQYFRIKDYALSKSWDRVYSFCLLKKLENC